MIDAVVSDMLKEKEIITVMRYKNEGKSKQNGVFYTPPQMADYVANEMMKYSKLSDNEDTIAILDPAVGEGELLVSMVSQVLNSGKTIIATGYETDEQVANNTSQKLQKMFPNVIVDIRCSDFLDDVEAGKTELYDFVIANPPYIRTQIMGSEKAQQIAGKLKVNGRVDIYYAFLIYTKKVLKENGISGYITSNKFMTIKAGTSVRNYMLRNYRLYQVTDLGDTKLFSSSVLPCIMFFSLGTTDKSENVRFTSVYERHDETDNYTEADSIFDVIYNSGNYKLPDGRCYRFQQGRLKSIETDELWTISSDENEKWLKRVESNTWMTFSDIGKVRVGIKTTADNVFIGDDWSGDKAGLEWLRPLITHRNAGQIVGNNSSQWKVLYTHTMKAGKKVPFELDDFPKTKDYLMSHYEQLSGRTYVIKAKRRWYEIWVPQNPDAWKHRKIVFRDISEKPQFWLDETGAIVNGDCYWIDIADDISEDVICLALAVANSSFIEKFYDIKFNTKLYSGKRRYQTQYVEQFPIPYHDSNLATQAISIVKKIIAEGNENTSSYMKTLDSLVMSMFTC